MEYRIFSPNYDQCAMLELTEDSSCRDAIWQKGQIIDKDDYDLSRLCFSSEHEHDLPFTDFSMDGNGCPVFSERLKNLLIETGVDNIEYFPATVMPFESEEELEGYYAGNIVGRIDCMDYDNSEYREINGKVFRIDKLAILPEKISEISICRLGPTPRIILADVKFDATLKSAGITGLHLIPIDQWDGAYGFV